MRLRHTTGLFFFALSAGCIFRAGGAVPDAGNADVGGEADAVSDGSSMDMSGADRGAGDVGIDMRVDTGLDVGEPVDIGPDAIDAGSPLDAASDMPAEEFVFRPFRTYHVVQVLRQSFLGPAPTEALDVEDQVLLAHLWTAWSSEVELWPADSPPGAGIDLAIVTTDSMLPDADGGLTVGWDNPADIALFVPSRSTFNDTHLMGGGVEDLRNPAVTIADPFSELVVGLPDGFKPYWDDNRQVGARTDPGPGSTPLEYVGLSGDTLYPLLAAESGSVIMDNETAGARRVAFGFDEVDALNELGWRLADNCLGYALGDPPPVQARAQCTLVVGGSVTPVDYHIASRMLRNGCDVAMTSEPPGADAGIVVASPTASNVVLVATSGHPSPVIAMFGSAGALSALNLAQNATPPAELGTSWVVDESVSEGLRANRTGIVPVHPSGPAISIAAGNLAPGALSVATRQSAPDYVTYFVVEEGEALLDGPAAADRVGLAMGVAMWTDGLPGGIAFFDAALQWAMWRTGN